MPGGPEGLLNGVRGEITENEDWRDAEGIVGGGAGNVLVGAVTMFWRVGEYEVVLESVGLGRIATVASMSTRGLTTQPPTSRKL